MPFKGHTETEKMHRSQSHQISNLNHFLSQSEISFLNEIGLYMPLALLQESKDGLAKSLHKHIRNQSIEYCLGVVGSWKMRAGDELLESLGSFPRETMARLLKEASIHSPFEFLKDPDILKTL